MLAAKEIPWVRWIFETKSAQCKRLRAKAAISFLNKTDVFLDIIHIKELNMRRSADSSFLGSLIDCQRVPTFETGEYSIDNGKNERN